MRHEGLYGDRVVRCFASANAAGLLPRPSSFHGMFAAAVAARPNAEAISCEGQRWTYAQCAELCKRLAAGLAERGIAQGDRVVLFVDNRPEFVFALMAIQQLGAIAVPVGVREQAPGLAYIIGQCEAIAVVCDAHLIDRLPDDASAPALRLRVTVGDVPDASNEANVPRVSHASAARHASSWVSLASLMAARSASQDLSVPPLVTETDVAVILYTSGTTGRPKGAMLTHLNIVHSVLHYQACMRLTPDDRSALAVPASHVTGLIAVIAAMIGVGGCTVIVPAFKADSFITLLQTERVTHTLMVPAMYQLCLMNPRFADADLSRWRIGGYGGAHMPVASIDALAERLPQLVLLNAYGATETTSPTTMMPMGQTRAHADSVGVALPAADILVMDDEGREVPLGETGELWIAGPMVVPGYWANPEATAASFTAGYWHSGDLGAVDAHGYVRVFDRKKDMLNRGGYKIFSVEVENVLMAWPGMVEAAIVGRPCPVLGERVHAFVHAPGTPPNDAALRAHCAARLADYKVPETLTWCDAPLPRNANGKLMKRVMRDGLT